MIEYFKLNKIEFNPTSNVAQLEELYQKHIESKIPEVKETSSVLEEKGDMEKLLDMMGTVVKKVGDMESRLLKVEGPTGSEFKKDAKEEDVKNASKSKEAVDDRVIKIVEETLGIDFEIEMEVYQDRPGFLFTVIIPKRLSDIPSSTRPIIDSDTGKYKVQADGKTPILEDYIPQDRRSRSIGSAQSYDAIRDHCNKVRSYLVGYYTKLSKPLPEFKIKS